MGYRNVGRCPLSKSAHSYCSISMVSDISVTGGLTVVGPLTVGICYRLPGIGNVSFGT